MIIHDYLTTVSCDRCSVEFSIERNLKEPTMRRLARKQGWIVVGEDDVCPACAAKQRNDVSEVVL